MASAEKRGDGPRPWRVRYKKPDGTWGSASGFETKKKALAHGNDQESDARAGRWYDAERGKITLDAYYAKWKPAQDISDSTGERYDSYYRNHIKPQWGDKGLMEHDPTELAEFEKKLRQRVAESTADGVMMVFREILEDATFEGRLQICPIQRGRRRGRRTAPTGRPGVALTLDQLEAIRARLPHVQSLLILTAAFTGMRWGEVAGMRQSFLSIEGDDVPYYDIDEKLGALHEDDKGILTFGPPKNRIGRTIELPDFLADRLAVHVSTLPKGQDLLFTTSAGTGFRRSNFNAWWRRACDGWPASAARRGHRAVEAAPPIIDANVHDTRRTHKTWLSEDGIDPVARNERLGHTTPGMDGVYIRATDVMRDRILDTLTTRWEKRYPPQSD